ncbi:hypothetical protein AtEden1_Chr5g0106981 [Arabidopsis thaliana]
MTSIMGSAISKHLGSIAIHMFSVILSLISDSTYSHTPRFLLRYVYPCKS